jgi:ubiquitin-like protein ATG12
MEGPSVEESGVGVVEDKVEEEKVIVFLQAVGGAPILKLSKFKLRASKPFHTITKFLQKHLKLETSDPLFLYCSSAFSPAPDEQVGELYKVYHTPLEL